MASNQVPELTSTHSTSPPSSASSNTRRVVCVFCGASSGTSPAHIAAARSLAQAFHKNNIFLVYGGGTMGVMGELAKTLVSLSGSSAVLGIIPEPLMKLEQHGTSNYGKTIVVDNMHTRKDLMAKEVAKGGPGSGFVALSGGFGTLEELMEVTTWNQLGIHGCGIVLFSVDGYYDGLLQWIKTAVVAGFISPGNAGILKEAANAEQVIEQLSEYQASKDRLALNWTQK